MTTNLSFDFEGRFAFVDHNGKHGNLSDCTLSLTDNYWCFIHGPSGKIWDSQLCYMSSPKNELINRSNIFYVRFGLMYRQELFFYCQSEEKADELINKFNELKQREEKEDEAKVVKVQKLIDDYLERMVAICRDRSELWISESGKNLMGEIKREVHTIGPHIPHLPHTEEECTLLIRKRIEDAIMRKELPGSINPKNNTYYFDKYSYLNNAT